jgi:Rhodanese-like domain
MTLVSAVLVSFMFGALPLSLGTAPQQRVATTSEVGLRQMAVTTVTPSYPEESVKAGTSGVAVAGVAAAAAGGAPTVEILEAPDAAIADAVRAALSKWKFPPVQFATSARLTFYFRIEQGKGRVLNPQEMPGGPAVAPRPTFSPGTIPVSKPATKANTRVLSEADTTPMTFAELQKLTGTNRPTILDVGARASFKRGHLDGAINIPHDELPVRAGIELRGRGRIVIDCTQEETFHCLFADHVLKDAGFKDVAILRR